MEKINTPKELVAAARQVIHYEEHESSYGSVNPSREMHLIASYFMTRSAAGRRKITWQLMLKLGINPLDLPTNEIVSPYTGKCQPRSSEESGCVHPIALAAVFGEKDAEIPGRLFLERVAQDYATESPGGKTAYAGSAVAQEYGHKMRRIVLPAPGPWMPPVTVLLNFFTTHAAWYSPGALSQALERGSSSGQTGYGVSGFLTEIGATLAAAGAELHLLQAAAEAWLQRSIKGNARGFSARQYGDQAELLGFVQKAAAERILRDKKGKAHCVLGVALQDAPADLMVEALRGLCRYEALPVMKYMRRGPTIQELRALRSPQGILNVLWHMPWDFLEPLVKANEGDLRAVVLKEATDNMAMAKDVLIDHPRRIKLAKTVGTDLNALANEWKLFKEGIRSRYNAAQELHCELQRLEPEVARVLLMDHLFPMDHLSDVRVLRNDRGLEAALAKWRSPFAAVEAYVGQKARPVETY